MIKVKGICAFTKQCIALKKHTKINIVAPLVRYRINQSKFFKPKFSLEALFNQNNIEFSDTSSNVYRLKYCPFCKKPHHNNPTNLYTLNVNKQNGLFYCHRCSAKGSYLELKRGLLGINVDPIYTDFAPNIKELEQQQIISQAQYFIYKQNMNNPQFSDVTEYLNSRGLTTQTLNKYNIGCGYETFQDMQGDAMDVKVMYFPMYKYLSEEEQRKKLLNLVEIGEEEGNGRSYVTELVKLKIRGVGKENKKYMRQTTGTTKGLFGLNTVKKSDKVVVLTQGQLDAMSVYQKTGIPSLSLPQGANSLPDSILPYLDQFEKIILWMDNDQAGKMNIDKFAQKLGVSRTYIVLNSQKQMKDANDFLQKKPQMIDQLIKKAKTIPDQNILTFSQLRDSIKQRLTNEKKFEGVPLQTFKFFNKKVKGIRAAQVSIISGATGSGKTTFLSQMSLQLCKKKIPTLWGSFQIRNQILISNMLTQFSDMSLKKHKHSFDHFADKFTQLPLYYMSFHGSNNINKVLGTITYAIEQYGVSFIVIDTLQFLLSGQAEGYKKFDMQDYVMSQLRSIATSYNVHIAVVIHPRKTEDNEDIGIHSIYGTSKATQQADNIWVIQNRDGFKIFQIKKNRYDGDVGRVAIGFNRNNKTFFELRKKQLQSLFNKQKTVSQILEDRQAEKKQKQDKGYEQWFTFEQEQSQGDEPEFKRYNKKKY